MTHPSPSRVRESVGDETAPETILELLNDDYVRTILEALTDGDKSAPTLAEDRDLSKPTVYRRLDRLENAGLVDARTVIDPNGHHRREFTASFDRVDLVLEGDTLTASIESAQRG